MTSPADDREGASPRDPLDYRCSDTERESVAEVVRTAMGEGRLDLTEGTHRLEQVFEARTYRDLLAVITDLPPAVVPPEVRGAVLGHGSGASGATDLHPYGPTGSPTPTGSAEDQVVAVLSGQRRRGEWTLAAECTATAVLGEVVLDLRDASLVTQAPVVRAYAVLGSVTIIVPDDITVVSSGYGIAGEFDSRREAAEGGPVIHLEGLALLGSVDVKRKRRKQPKRRKRSIG